MKRLLLLLIAVTAFSCSTDDAEPVNVEANIEGDWRQTSFKLASTGQTFDMSNCETFANAKVFTFSEDGLLHINNACEGGSFNFPYTAQYERNNNIITISNQNPHPDDQAGATLYEGKYQVNIVNENVVGMTKIESEFGLGIGDYTVFQKQ